MKLFSPRGRFLAKLKRAKRKRAKVERRRYFFLLPPPPSLLLLLLERRPKVRVVMYAWRGWAGIRAHVGGPRSLRGLHLRGGEVYARATAISSWRDKFRDIFRRGKLMFP